MQCLWKIVGRVTLLQSMLLAGSAYPSLLLAVEPINLCIVDNMIVTVKQ